MTFEKATRQSTHLIVSFSGPSGCGKSLSALRFARGLVGPEGKIGALNEPI
jgi:DNA polymerase III delta prime subunit